MSFIEAPTTFYMGRRFDPTTRRLVDEVVYYDSRDLTTHAVVVGMTGSGKTGLCVTLLEEAVMDNIPSIIIDPKGDITNLMLAFPDLKPEEFAPWVNVDDARRAGMEPEEYAVEVAQEWREGLAGWGIGPQRVATYKNNARFTIYTPGSDAGMPISILDAMHAPRDGFDNDQELHRERLSGIVTALLALIGKSADPLKDREHILIANIFEYAWRRGQDLTLEDVILQVQKPPFTKLGVFDVETSFPEKDRFALAMELNNIMAAPSFQSWLQGEPLDIQSLLYTPEGKPRVSIFYVAHLNDAERMFIVTLLLENVLAWMRTLSGTTSLRALLYFDEVFGFFPPHPYNPPTKTPLARLLKQARAFGLGLVLATQNPGDLDYKGLSNAGTWFIGKLQTENDKNRVLTGLESAVGTNSQLHVDDIDRLLSSIDPRVFVMNNVHDNGGPIAMHTRWAMSYLRGPLTRQQIRVLMADQREQPYYPPYQQGQKSSLGQGNTPVPQGTQPVQGTGPRLAEPPVRAGATPPPMSLPEMPEPPVQAGSTPRPASLPDFGAPPLRPTTPEPAPANGSTMPSVSVGTFSPDLTQPSIPLDTGLQSRPVAEDANDVNGAPPPVSATTAQYYLPTTVSREQAMAAWERKTGIPVSSYGGAALMYRPILLAQAQARYTDRKSDVTTVQAYAYHVPHVARAGLIHWDEYRAPYTDPRDLSQTPLMEAGYGDLSPGLADGKRLTELKREVVDYIYQTASLVLMHNPGLDLYGQPEMNRRDFLIQAQTLARQARDGELDKVMSQYDKKFDDLEARLRKKARDLAAGQQQFDAVKNEEMFTTGEALLSLLRGRTTYTLSRVSRARRYKNYVQEDVTDAEAAIAELEAQVDGLHAEMENALHQIQDRWARAAAVVEDYRITPYKKDIYLDAFGIGWKPHWVVVVNGQQQLISAWGD